MTLEKVKIEASSFLISGIDNTITYAAMAVKLHDKKEDKERLDGLLAIAKQASQRGFIDGNQMRFAANAAKELRLEGLV